MRVRERYPGAGVAVGVRWGEQPFVELAGEDQALARGPGLRAPVCLDVRRVVAETWADRP